MVRIEYEGHKLTKAWSGRLLCEIKDHKSVEKWERDIRHTIEKPEILIWHPVVEPPTQAEKAMYSKQWQPDFFDEQGTTVPEGTTMDDCKKYNVLITRNVGGFSKSDYFRAYTRTSKGCPGHQFVYLESPMFVGGVGCLPKRKGN